MSDFEDAESVLIVLKIVTRSLYLGACFCQFKIDQARQLNFDQGLKPVF